MGYIYPEDFALKIRGIWASPLDTDEESATIQEPSSSAAWLALEDLEKVLATCYQASLLRDEARILSFRLILCPPSAFDGVETKSYSVMPFEKPRRFSDSELRRLAPAVDFYRGLIGVQRSREGKLEIWGLVHSGPEWIQVISGGRGRFTSLPNWPVISVLGPGRLSVARGSFTLATLRAGRMWRTTLDVFDSEWLPEVFAESRHDLYTFHSERVRERGGPHRKIDPNLPRALAQHALRRMMSLMRQARHGGTLLFLPNDSLDQTQRHSLLNIKYPFAERDARRQFRWALLDILEFLACDYMPESTDETSLNWNDYVRCTDERLEPLDQRLFEFAHLVSELSAVDGAVILNKRFELIGFGAEIGHMPEVNMIARALDANAYETELESHENFGTRHRSAFRFCKAEPDSLAIVVSQDGTVFMVKKHQGQITYWDQIAVSALDI